MKHRLFLVFLFATAVCVSIFAQSDGRRPAPIVAMSEDGVPIRAYGELYVNDVSPDFIGKTDRGGGGNAIQLGNAGPKMKIQPLKSWEIGNNYFGTTPPRVPRTAQTDRQFFLPINLIDGNPGTHWVSRGQGQAGIEPEWIRLDLAWEKVIDEIVLYPVAEPLPKRGIIGLGPNPDHLMSYRYDNPWPKKLTIKMSLDAWHWETVYETNDLQAPKLGEPVRINIPPRPAKQVWIIGEMFGSYVQGPFNEFWGRCWAVGEIQALKNASTNNSFVNHALASKGAGVTTSSTHYGYQGRRQELEEWWPLHYDIGLKWLRIAFWTSVLNWHYVEQEKGVYTIDELADATITESARNGVRVVMGLMYGNWLYTDTPKDNFAARQEVIPFDPPPPPVKEEHIQGYLNFVRFMVHHFKGRVYAWEVWNEPLHNNQRYGWGTGDEAANKYLEIVQRAIPIIREEDPEAKILVSGQLHDRLEVVASQVDIIDYIRWGGQRNLNSSAYRSQSLQFKKFKKWIREKGFQGDLFFSLENRWHGAPYPYHSTYVSQTTEMQQAKILARTMVRHAAMGIVSFWNETWNSALTTGDVGLLRHGFNSGPSHNMSVRPGYYVYRTLCTVFNDAEPDAGFEVELDGEGFKDITDFSPDRKVGLEGEAVEEIVDVWKFRNKNGERLVALWMKGNPDRRDVNPGVLLHLRLPSPATQVIAVDTLNGVEQALQIEREGNATVIRNLVVYDYPLVLRIE